MLNRTGFSRPLRSQTPATLLSLINSGTSKIFSGAIVNLQQIVAELKAERNQLDQAIAALNGISTPRRRGRPPKSDQIATRPKRRRRLSAEGRRRISEAVKKRWAKVRRKAA